MSKIIGSEQSAFSKGRLILDGILILNEVVADLKKKKQKSFIFKIDFEKAFDSVNLEFLFDTMRLMGFGEKWRKWIESCFKSASVSVLVNGSPTSEFSLRRGIRQGDPLYPFLFLIAGEGLNYLANNARSHRHIKGVEIGSNKVVLSHLQYADDTHFHRQMEYEEC
ncbi:secreted RxLR effector protein 78-like [Rutidosis leptorrhynchoides]|uniref:secreted RxLR effector protein 78-like n=1 Tax=Rutidosis leptorrhynchoides TaxID=125765 RepID=UPI003A9980FB